MVLLQSRPDEPPRPGTCHSKQILHSGLRILRMVRGKPWMANLLAADCLLQSACCNQLAAECLPRTELINAAGQTSFALEHRRLGTQSLGRHSRLGTQSLGHTVAWAQSCLGTELLGHTFAPLRGNTAGRSIRYRIPSRRSVSSLRIVLPLTNWLGTKLF